ncbi:hypothetical protein [Rhizobium sp. No.120]
MERALRAEYPHFIPASQLCNLIALSWQSDPVRAFTLLCISFSKLNQDLRGSGWQAVRTDGTPEAHYSLSPVGGG